MFDLILTIALFLVVIIVMPMGLKIAAEDQRFAVFTLGRFAGFSGPGLVLAAPFVTRLYALNVGDSGVMTGTGFAKFDKTSIPVKNTLSLTAGQAIRIDGFDGTEPRIVSAIARPVNHCPNCGHQY